MSSTIQAKTFGYEGLAVAVRAEDPAHLRWLEEFLFPHFEVSDGDAGEVTVELIIDRDRFVKLRKGGVPGDEVDCFALDSKVIRLPWWRSDVEDRVIRDEGQRVFYLMKEAPRHIVVLAGRALPRVRTPVMRVVRELAMNHVCRNGGLLIHGSSFSLQGRGILVAGPKRSGKTTMLIHASRHPAVRYVANDRVLVRLDDGTASLRGMPSICTIREAAGHLFPDLEQSLLKNRYHFRMHLEEGPPPIPVDTWANGKWSLTPAQFCRLLDMSPQREEVAHALVFPQVVREPGGVRWSVMEADDAAHRLEDALFGRGNLLVRSDLFAPPASARNGERDLAELCRRLTAQVPCYDVELRRDAADGNPSVLAFLRHIVEGGA